MKLTITFTTILSLTSSTIASVYGVTGNFGHGDLEPNSIYQVEPNGTTTKIADTSVQANSLAVNNIANIYYYGDHSGSNLYGYDLNTGNNTLIADLNDHGMPSNFTLSGGADFYNGTYYYSPELPEITASSIPQQAHDIFAVNFSADGLSIVSHTNLNVTLPQGWSSLGDFGDIAVDTSEGVLYGSSWAINGTINDGAFLWKVDLDDPNKQVQVIAQTSISNDNVYQIAYDAIEGALYANEWNTEEYLVLDTTTGDTISTTTIAGNFYDLASSAAPVPEPSSTFLLGLATTFGFIRRKRSYPHAKTSRSEHR